MDTWTAYDVRYADHRARVARIECDGWKWGRPTPDAVGPAAPATPALARCLQEREDRLLTGARRPLGGAHGVVRLVAAALGRLAALAHDSRDGLRSKEREVAAHGIRWGRGCE
jgi:hypothetical protein